MSQQEDVHDPARVAEYFAGQLKKSSTKINWQYGRMFRFAGLYRVPRPKRLADGQLLRPRVLDAGCGAGPGLRYLANQGYRPCGIDYVYYAVERAQEQVHSALLAVADLTTHLPFQDDSFDVILLGDVIEHFPQEERLLQECRRVLRPGGVVIITTPNTWDMRRIWHWLRRSTWSGHQDPSHINLFSPWRLRQALGAVFPDYRLRTGSKPLRWVRLPGTQRRFGLPYPPLVGNGIIAAGYKE